VVGGEAAFYLITVHLTEMKTHTLHSKYITGQKILLFPGSMRIIYSSFPSELNPVDRPFSRKRNKTHKPSNYVRSESSYRRARSKIRTHILCNFKPNESVFLTLTYAANQQNRNQALKDFDLFRRSLTRKYKDIRFLSTMENQKRGAYHFHILINKKYISQLWLEKNWPHGYRFIVKTYGKPRKLANYISKYVSKENTVEIGDRLYTVSRNLEKPAEIKGFDSCEAFLSAIDKSQYIMTRQTGWLDVDNLGCVFIRDYDIVET
jgi:hypothetical protein